MRYPILSYGLLGLLSSAIVLYTPGIVVAQNATPGVPPQIIPSPFAQLERSLPKLSLVTSTLGDVDRAVVRVDGRRLFTIAVPNVDEKSRPGESQGAIENRATLLEDRLQTVINRNFDPQSLQVRSEIDSSSRQPIVYAQYEANGRTYNDEVMTVTALDAEINGSNLADWGEQLSIEIQEALLRAHAERQSSALQGQIIRAVITLLAIGISSLSLANFQRQLQKERRVLSAQSKTDSEQLSVSANSGDTGPATTELLQRRVNTQQRQGMNDIKRRAAQLFQALLWGGGIFFIVGLFPYTRWFQPLVLRWAQIPFRLVLVGLITYVIIRLSGVLVDRFFWALQNSASFDPSTSQRLILRFTTFSRVAKSIAGLVCVTIGLLVAIAMLGIQISPALLTLTGVAGVGISLASQNVIKDFINGFLILLEDQYGVGDVVNIGEVTGLVENMNLRITQLRNEEGRLITVPNSAITIVQNLSKEWSRVDINISVSHTADINQALSVVGQVAAEMSRDPRWLDLILEPPLLLGVDKLDHTGATVRIWIKTRPLKQWDVAREYRRRLKMAFDEANIPIGVPQQSLWFNNKLDLDESLEEQPNHRQETKLRG